MRVSDCRNPKERMACAVAEFVQAFANLIPRDEQDAFRMDVAHALQGPNWMGALYRELQDWGKTLDAYDTPGLVEHLQQGMDKARLHSAADFINRSESNRVTNYGGGIWTISCWPPTFNPDDIEMAGDEEVIALAKKLGWEE